MIKVNGEIESIWNKELVWKWDKKRPKVDLVVKDEDDNTLVLTLFWEEQVMFASALNVWDKWWFLFNLKAKEYNWKYYQSLTIFKFKIKEKAETLWTISDMIDDELPF